MRSSPGSHPLAHKATAGTDRGLFALIEEVARNQPDAPAVLAPERDSLSYAELLAHVRSTAGALRHSGLGRQSRIAVVLPNGPEMAAAFLSTAVASTSAPLNPNYKKPEFEFYLSDLAAEALIVEEGGAPDATDVAHAMGIQVIELATRRDAGAALFALSIDAATDGEDLDWNAGDDVVLCLHTSGTTSRPKQVPLTHANLCASANNIAHALALAPSDRCLNIMPLFHIHGLMAALLASLASGASVVCTPGFYAPQFFGWMEDFHPTWYTAVPTMHQSILDRAAADAAVVAGASLRFIRSSSAALPPSVLERLERTFGTSVVEAYGMTEAAHQMASNPLPPAVRKPGSVGKPAGPEVAILGKEGARLGIGSVGEVAVRGPNIMGGYVNNPAANGAAFTGAWFRTGDEGYFDEDGYLFLTGRLKEIINRGGEKISPREIDEVLLDHPAVSQAVAFALPHDRLGEDVGAVVVLSDGPTITEQQLRSFAASRLARFKVPSRILFAPEIPKGATGKLQRIGLAERLGLTAADPSSATPPHATYAAPRTAVESMLGELWTDVLGLERLSIHDRFLDVGGDSMLAGRLANRIRERLQIEVPLVTFFDASTVAEQAALIEHLLLGESSES